MTIAIRAELDAQTSALVKRVADSQGRSVEEFAAQAIRVAAEEAELLGLAQTGQADFSADRWISHEQMVEFLEFRRRERAPS